MHAAAGMAVATHPDGLLPLTQHAMRFHNRIGRHDHEDIALDAAECGRLARNLGRLNAFILNNQGLLTCGASVAEAFGLMYYLERAYQAQVVALGLHGSTAARIGGVCGEDSHHLRHTYGADASQRDWVALLRKA